MAYALHEWDSKYALEEKLRADPENWILVGQDADSPKKFYSFEVNGIREGGNIAILSSDLGIKPTVEDFNGRKNLAVLHDSSVSFVECENLELTRAYKLNGVGFQLLTEKSRNLIIVIHELGVDAFDFHSDFFMRVKTFIDGKIGTPFEFGFFKIISHKASRV